MSSVQSVMHPSPSPPTQAATSTVRQASLPQPVKLEPSATSLPSDLTPDSVSSSSTSASPSAEQHCASHAISGTQETKDVSQALKGDSHLSGRIVCDSCDSIISIRDDATGKFTGDHWERHRLECPTRPHIPQPNTFKSNAYPTFAVNPGEPLLRRRRAKRTEQERINYLKSDPYVSQFEAYRVLCAICDKWIRLRPNSTYCSIPWDAHRKSCLARRGSQSSFVVHSPSSPMVSRSSGGYTFAELQNLLSQDRDVRKFDAERVLCRKCDVWIGITPHDHLAAVQTWLQHRAKCSNKRPDPVHGEGSSSQDAQPANTAERGSNSPRSSSHELQRASPNTTRSHDQQTDLSSPHTLKPIDSAGSTSHYPSTSAQDPRDRPSPGEDSSTLSVRRSPGTMSVHSPRLYPLSPSSTNDRSPVVQTASALSAYVHGFNTTPLPMHDSRRRNAEQRAAALRADRLISQVEPNRVFCSLCQKWVQLRQDSTYCAYPWLQHRGKCLARHQRRAEKAAQIAHAKAQKEQHSHAMYTGYPPPPLHPSIPNSHSIPSVGLKRPRDYDSDREDVKRSRILEEVAEDEERSAARSLHETRIAIERLTQQQMAQERELVALATARRHRTSSLSPMLSRTEAPASRRSPISPGSSPQSRRPSIYIPSHLDRGCRFPPSHVHESEHGRYFVPRLRPVQSGEGYDDRHSDQSSETHDERSCVATPPQRCSSQDRSHPKPDRKVSPDVRGTSSRSSRSPSPARSSSRLPDQVSPSSSPLLLDRSPPRRSAPTGLADLDSDPGRQNFIWASIRHLFSTTYEPTDELSISALHNYLAAAMPQDKFEDFDVAEIVRTLASLREAGRIVLVEDVIKLA